MRNEESIYDYGIKAHLCKLRYFANIQDLYVHTKKFSVQIWWILAQI